MHNPNITNTLCVQIALKCRLEYLDISIPPPPKAALSQHLMNKQPYIQICLKELPA